MKIEKIIEKRTEIEIEDTCSMLDIKLKKRTKIRTILSILAIIIGLLLMLYPKLSNLYDDYQQKMLIKRWQESFLMIEEVEQSVINEYGVDNDTTGEPSNIDSSVEVSGNLDSIETEEIEENTYNENTIDDKYIIENMVGMLIIDDIDLNLPILNETTKENLSIALTSIEPENEPGQVGNLAIAGHRSHDFGRNFNRLDEITDGDLIKVNVGKTIYTYEVTEKLIVKPEETWVLKGDGESKEVTLVTCHPLKNPTHRLIIKGKIIE